MSPIVMHHGRVRLYEGDSREVLKALPDNSVDSCSCDPPYALTSVIQRFGGDNAAPAGYGTDGLFARASAGFMGQKWDTGETAFAVEFWREVRRVLKPGGHLVAFGGTRTYHHLAMAIDMAGFEIRDQLAWAYGTGFPKSHPVGQAIDKHLGAERTEATGSKRSGIGRVSRDGGEMVGGTANEEAKHITTYAPATPEAAEWEGWGTALKPAWEPICLARKPLSEKTVAANVLRWGTGALNIDACRVVTNGETPKGSGNAKRGTSSYGDFAGNGGNTTPPGGRFPANLLHDGSPEVLDFFPDDTGRFFYSAKASKEDREEGCGALPVPEGKSRANFHPTVKPTPVMEWVNRLITPPGGVILDPFMGSGSTGKAAVYGGFQFIGIDAQADFVPIARARIAFAAAKTPFSEPEELDYDGY